ncbi:MAG: FAD-dependent oxidoreductase [Candidatus Eiseniibacteriota bacterium]
MSERRVLILGAGPAGLGAALRLARRGFSVEVLERRELVGGNAASFDVDGLRADYGSHRLHPATDPEILAELRTLLGEDLLTRPRHGRIRLSGRWIHFPLKLGDLVVHAPPAFAFGVGLDLVGKVFAGGSASREDTFASVLRRGLGRTICEEFYFPFARKIWGLDPAELSPIQARRRVSAGSIAKMLKRLRPSSKADGKPGSAKSFFYYPRRGFGQISDRLHEAAVQAGAKVTLGAAVERVELRRPGFAVTSGSGGESSVRDASALWSTIPAPLLVTLIEPRAPADVLEAAGRLELRAMVLVYLVLDQGQYTEFDAHYFPGRDVPFTRLSEPKNYAAVTEPRDRTLLCAEMPCSPADPLWKMTDAELGRMVLEGLRAAGLPAPRGVRSVQSRRLAQAYPIYRSGYEAHFERVDGWLAGIEGLLSFGRQGLFAHDNTHHTLAMAHAAVGCLRDDGTLDQDEWARHRRIFETHVVED